MLKNNEVSIENYNGKNDIILINNLGELKKITFRAKIRYELEEESDIEKLKDFKNKDIFLELIIPNKFEDKVKELSFADRLIFDNPENLNKLFSECILNDIYPLTKNIPMCHTKIENTFELFNKKGSDNEKCKNCIYKTHCSYNEKFTPIPKEKDEEFEKFIKDEGIIHRI